MPTKDEAQKWLDAALTEAKAATPDCAKATTSKARIGLVVAAPPVAFVRTNEQAFVAMARCAEKEHAYLLLFMIAGALIQVDPKNGHPELVARGLLGLGEFAAAERVLTQELHDRPRDANVNLTMAKALCRVDKWAECGKQADATLAIVGAPRTQEDREVAWRAYKYRSRALLHVGKFDDAVKAAEEAGKLGAPAGFADEMKKEVIPAKASMAVIEKEMSDRIPLGGYHLFGKVASVGSVLDVRVFNVDRADHQYKIEAEITGVTERSVQTVAVLAGKTERLHMNPPLKTTFDVNSVRADIPGQMAIKVTRVDNGVAIADETLPLTILPRDTLPLERFYDRDHAYSRNTFDFVGAWITPNAKAVDEFLAAAKKRLVGKQSFSGGQSETMPQVKAIYDELKARGMSYVMDPELFFGGGDLTQRTRLPSDVLQSTNAQCLEGAILYATLFEAIGLHPGVVMLPTHAFVAWHPEGHDQPPALKSFFLETTATHGFTFEQNIPGAAGEYDAEIRAGHVAQGAHGRPPATQIVWVDALRAAGVTPQPWN